VDDRTSSRRTVASWPRPSTRTTQSPGLRRSTRLIWWAWSPESATCWPPRMAGSTKKRCRPLVIAARGSGFGAADEDRRPVDVDGLNALSPEASRRDRQDGRATAEIEHGIARLDQLLKERQTHPGGRVEASPERHPRVEPDHQIVGAARPSPPRRHDHDALAD